MMSGMQRQWLTMAVVVGAHALAQPPDSIAEFTSLGEAERRAYVKATPREQLERVMKETPQARLLGMGQRIIQGVNSYSYRMTKQERVRGELLPEQTIDVFVREAPFAVRLHYVKGPGAGRKLVYNPAVRTDEFRVKEAGLLSVAGAIWLSVDSSFAKGDSNHLVPEAGIGPLLGRLLRDTERARPMGGFTMVPEGWNAQGEFCGAYTAPVASPPFEYAKTRICTDLHSGVPMKVEGYGVKGELLEKWHFANFKPDSWPTEFFDPTKARL